MARLFHAIEAMAAGHRVLANVIAHNVLFAAAFFLAFIVRFDAGVPFSAQGASTPWFIGQYLAFLPYVLFVKSLIYAHMRLFHGHWRYSSTRDVWRIVWAAWWFVLVTAIVVVLTHYIPVWMERVPPYRYSNGVLLLDFILSIFLVCTARLAVRLYREELRPVSAEGLTRVIIVGAGNAAETLIREINRMTEDRYRVIGLVDDSPHTQGLYIHDLPVLGRTEDLKELCEEHEVDEILIALPSPSHRELRHVVELCRGANLKFKTMPGVNDLIDGRFNVSQIQDVDINDLLGREVIDLDREAVSRFIADRRIMITGAGGSIGSEMCRQVAAIGPACLILVEQAENPLFDIAGELNRRWPGIPVVSIICDIYDRQRVMAVFDQQRPEVVIHAAAHKHVPLMEHNPCEAIKNNILGTRNVADASVAAGVAEFVMISTDKAVNPSSVMGCSKRVAELYAQSLNGNHAGNGTQFMAVRFGNVLGSAGSVVPIFKRQIAEGGPVRVTHPEMTRYFMTIPEASQLVLQAAATGTGGQIFLLDMGDPVKIVDLARDLITLSGFRPDEDIEIVFTGVRPGEKLFEELRTDGEDIVPTTHEKVNVWRTRGIDPDVLAEGMARLEALVNCPDREAILAALKRLVPEYEPLNPPAPAGTQQRRTESRPLTGRRAVGSRLSEQPLNWQSDDDRTDSAVQA
ncbi:MAG: polysaccharide biosynthesis protein [Planctomycetes bacterium]|nr:polysaccharide biosynthesis protein [Planctomycetota bacterium]